MVNSLSWCNSVWMVHACFCSLCYIYVFSATCHTTPYKWHDMHESMNMHELLQFVILAARRSPFFFSFVWAVSAAAKKRDGCLTVSAVQSARPSLSISISATPAMLVPTSVTTPTELESRCPVGIGRHKHARYWPHPLHHAHNINTRWRPQDVMLRPSRLIPFRSKRGSQRAHLQSGEESRRRRYEYRPMWDHISV